MGLPVWEECSGGNLEQGNLLPQCLVPVFPDDFDPYNLEEGSDVPFQFSEYDLIILTQTCDLVQGKMRKITLCPIYRLSDFRNINSSFTKNKLSDVQKGRIFGLHYLPPLPDDNDDLIVDFREIYSLSFNQISRYASSLDIRWGLRSPAREALSQAFGMLFSRVALPDRW